MINCIFDIDLHKVCKTLWPGLDQIFREPRLCLFSGFYVSVQAGERKTTLITFFAAPFTTAIHTEGELDVVIANNCKCILSNSCGKILSWRWLDIICHKQNVSSRN